MTQQEQRHFEKLLNSLARMRLDEYVEYVSNAKRMFWRNLFYGMARGLGFTVGFSVLGAAAMVLLSRMVVDNIPVIGDFLAEVVNAIKARM